VEEVHVPAFPVDRFLPYIGDERYDEFERITSEARRAIGHRTIWNINSTASGGGVAEMLHVLLAYARGAGFDARWLVMEGDPEFFALTKRIHHLLHGNDPKEEVTDDDRGIYEDVARRNADGVREVLREGDIVIVHDPQPAGLVSELSAAGAHVIWRCHVGADEENAETRAAWSFLEPYLADADAHVFSRQAYVPPLLRDADVTIIPPSIDPFSPKNEDLDPETVGAVLRTVGLFDGDPGDVVPRFVRTDGSPGRVDRRARIDRLQPVPPDAPLVVQVSRWDPLKDMLGVMQGFADHLEGHEDAHLALVGPDVTGVSDDPEGAQVLAECTGTWESLPDEVRSRIHLVSLPMEDLEENAVMVNAIQRHAAVVVQKSLAEGFGLTVTEAMWKGRPVVASGVGGINDQITDGEDGLLLDDPRDLSQLGVALDRVLSDPEGADRLGRAARERVTHNYLSDRHLEREVTLAARLVD
jgi:trehalose synthase